MIWRIGGWLTIFFAMPQLAIFVWMYFDPLLDRAQIDWPYVRESVRVALWVDRSHVVAILAFAAAPLAAVGFFRIADKRKAAPWFLTYATLLAAILPFHYWSAWKLEQAGSIPTGKNGSIVCHFNVLEETVEALYVTLPLWYILFALLLNHLRQRKRDAAEDDAPMGDPQTDDGSSAD